jgi:tetratricopeptide (TPR) repeat protein
MSADSDFSPHVRLGIQCRELKRFAEAERHFKDALAQNPHDDLALHLLASAVMAQDGREREALEIVNRAIAADPNDANHHALRAFILNDLERHTEALSSANTARGLDPYCVYAYTAKAQSYLLLKDWKDAEMAAREALALDPDESDAANFLAQALRMQGRHAENDAQIRGLLERDPEDPTTHMNAGWSALHRGDHRSAEVHFREALRLDPECDYAREGLLTSFRARSPLYRGYLSYCLWMARMKEKNQWITIIAIYVGYRIVRELARQVSPMLAIGIGVLYFLFVLWGFVANAVGNFILLFDRFARYALRMREKVEAIAVGGGVVCGVVLLPAGMALNLPGLMVAGGALIAAALPGSMAITNRSIAGAVLFGSISGTILITAAVAEFALLLGNRQLFEGALGFLLMGAIAAALSTWLSGISFLRR